MKTTLSRVRWLNCLLLLLAGVMSAQAFYNPTTGRWLSRDPIGEKGGKNVYGFVHNEPTALVDSDGRAIPVIFILGAAALFAWELHTIYSEPEIDGVDHLLNAGIVPACHIVIFIGHNRSQEPRLPSGIQNSACSYGSVVSCSGSTISVESELPGIDQRPDEYTLVNFAEAAAQAERDFAVAVSKARGLLCGKGKCCRTVTIRVACTGVSANEINLSPALRRVCGRTQVIKCP